MKTQIKSYVRQMTSATKNAILAIRRSLSSMLESIDVIDRNLHKMEEDITPKMITKTILLTGDCDVGKTSFIEKLKTDQVCYEYIPTDCISSYDIVDNDRNMFYIIYDMTGETKKEQPKDMFHWFDNVDHIIVMCSIEKYSSFKSLKEWMEQFSYFKKPFSVLINKCDLSETVSMKKEDKCEKRLQNVIKKYDANTSYISIYYNSKDELLQTLYKLVNN